uniref:Uncharacterized protein n=1 Tax=Ciona intestinalis TaxID=7719 RepID=H2XLE7_CIOIN
NKGLVYYAPSQVICGNYVIRILSLLGSTAAVLTAPGKHVSFLKPITSSGCVMTHSDSNCGKPLRNRKKHWLLLAAWQIFNYRIPNSVPTMSLVPWDDGKM